MKKLCAALLLSCLFLLLSLPADAITDTLAACHVPDPVSGQAEAVRVDTGKKEIINLIPPEDGVTVVFCHQAYPPNGSMKIISETMSAKWSADPRLRFVSIEVAGSNRDFTSDAFFLYAKDALSRMDAYCLPSTDIASAYRQLMTCPNTSGLPIVALITMEGSIPTLRFCQAQADDVELLYNSVCTLIPDLSQTYPPEVSDESGTIGDCDWYYDSATRTLTIQGSGSMGTSSSQPWASFKNKVRNIVVEEGVKTISPSAFSDMKQVTQVTLPDTMELFGSGAFSGCSSLTEIIVPEGITLLPWSCFKGCTALKRIHLPDTLKSIEENALVNTGLTELIIPPGIQNISYYSMSGSPELKKIIFLGDALDDMFYSFHLASQDAVIYYREDASGYGSTFGDYPAKPFRYTVNRTAHCTDAVLQTITSIDPSFSYTLHLLPVGHDMTRWELVRPATQEEDGQWKILCSRCDNADPEYVTIPKLPAQPQNQVSSYNKNNQNYITWATTVKSTLVSDKDGFLRVEALKNQVIAERYDKDLRYLDRVTINFELPIFGGYYTDGNYHFLLFGQNNYNEDNSQEVFRLVRYSLQWQRMDSLSLYGENTYIPFKAGSVRMTHCEDMLFISTCHQMYISTDGLRHQENVFFQIHIPSMEVTFRKVTPSDPGHASHSFNQFVLLDDNRILTVHHADAYNRSAMLIRYPLPANGSLAECFDYTSNKRVSYEDTLMFRGEIGDNTTGASLGGFAASDTHYLIAGNTIDQSSGSFHDTRNIYITATQKSFDNKQGTEFTTFRQITNYSAKPKASVSTPQLVKLSNNHFLLMWMKDGSLQYIFLDGTGAPQSDIQTAPGCLSDCQPILSGNRVIWYVTDGSKPVFYSLDVDIEPKHPFSDVKNDRFLPAILWAYKNGITTGTSDTTFSPENSCTRKQIVTFLWRAAGEPEPKSMYNPFKDVPSDRFEKAILWAYHEGITAGTGDGSNFSPESTCTRKQIVTFLWRFRGQPDPESMENIFSDVKNDRFAAPILWAAAQGITAGTGDGSTFSPEAPCTRKQIVTFLYRNLSEDA